MNFLRLLWGHLSLCLLIATAHARILPISISLAAAPPPADPLVDDGTWGFYPTDTYITEDALNGPKTNFVQWSDRCNDGSLYFLTPRGWGIDNPGPMLLDHWGKLVWSKHYANSYGGQAYDFTVQSYKGQDYLTFWLGDDRVRGHGSGAYYMLNASYDEVYRVGAANGMSADLHEFLITPQNTALMTTYQVLEYDLAEFPDYHPDEDQPGPSYIWDCVFQEIDIETGVLVNQWRASDHINVSTTYRGIGPGGSLNDPFDWFHMNSVEKDELGNYLVSARYVHSLTYIDGKTGDIIWTLGGRLNDFMDLSGGNAINFAWQHDARFLPPDTFPNLYTPPQDREGFITRLVTMFDNAAEDQHYEWGMPLSRGLLLEVTYPTQRTASSVVDSTMMAKGTPLGLNEQKVVDVNGTNPDYTVRVIKSYENPDGIRSSSQGSMQVLPQGPGTDPKVFVGYGLNAVWTEFDADGTVLCNAHYGAITSWERGDIQSYRTYKFPWVGAPQQPPEVEISDDEAEVYVSWNGATEVASWILQCSDSNTADEKAWADAQQMPREDFETALSIADEVANSKFLRVIAIDRNGHRLDHGTSRVLDRGVMTSFIPSVGTKLTMDVSRAGPLNIVVTLVFAVSTALALFGLYWRYLKWRTGKISASRIRRRKGSAYQLLGGS